MTYPSADDLQYFFEISRCQNMSQAAVALGVRQSTLSIAVKRIEATLGCPIFNRSKSGVELTQAGKVFAKEAKAFYAHWSSLRVKVGRDSQRVTGQFRIGGHPSAGILVLPRVLPTLLADYPDLQFEIVTEYSGTVIEQVKQKKFDLGISATIAPDVELERVPIMAAEIGLWAHKSVATKQLQSLIYDSAIIGYGSIMRQIKSRRLVFTGRMPVGNLELVAALVESKAGVGILPDVIAKRLGKDMRCVDPRISFRSPIGLYHRPELEHQHALKVVIQHFRRLATPTT